MKKLFFSIFALIGFAVSATAQTVTVADVEALPGETVTATLNLEAPADTYTGFQLSLQFPATGFSVEKDVATGWSGSINNNAINSNSGGLVKIAAGGNNTFTNASINLDLTVDANLSEGSYDVTVSGQFEGPDDGYGNDIITPITNLIFKVKVVSAHTVVLDENSTTAPVAATGVNVNVKRTITAGNWSTICLPFAMTEAQVKAAFGDDVALGDFKGWKAEYDDADAVVGINVSFEQKTEIEANHPYIIKTSSSYTDFTVDGVNIKPEVEPAVSVGRINKGTLGSFTGSYVPVAIDEECLFLNANKFWYSKGNTQMKGYRAYFYFQVTLADYGGTSSARVKMSITDGDGKTTNIDPRTMQTIEDGKVYNMNGQYVGKAEDANSLPKGIYIVNGKKKVIK